MSILPKQPLIVLTIVLILLSLLRLVPVESQDSMRAEQPSTPKKQIVPTPIASPQSFIIPEKSHVIQTFNNCGPATLSMALSYSDIYVSQDVLGKKLRPWQNSEGINDDKSVFLPELASEAKEYQLVTYHRPNGSIPLLKSLISQGIPIIVRTWLHPGEDIGHYRIIRGYDDTRNEIIQDDSYIGDDLRYSYEEFLQMWKPFNYEYLIIVRPEKEGVVKQLLGAELNEKTAYLHANERAQKDMEKDPSDYLAQFNLSTSYYYLGKYQESVKAYESVASILPFRTLWYQLEPIEAYLKLKQHDTVLSLTNSILSHNNLAYSELYLIRAEVYRVRNEKDLAKAEAEKALLYNKNLPAAKSALQELEKNKSLVTRL